MGEKSRFLNLQQETGGGSFPFDLNPQHDLYRRIQRQFIRPDREPRMLPRIPENVRQQRRGGVQYEGLTVKSGRRLNVPLQSQYLLDPIQRTDGTLDLGECIQQANPSGVSPLLFGQILTQFPLKGDFLPHERQLPARYHDIPKLDHGNIRSDGCRGGGKFETKLNDPGFV